MAKLPSLAITLCVLVLTPGATQAATAITGIRDTYPDLSPNGQALLFHSNRSGRQAIWIAKADGTEPRILFDDLRIGTDPGTPRWSPDGRLIVFAMRPAGTTDENESEIYLINKDGSRLRRLTRAPGDDSHPHWSSDGKRIFFNSARATPDQKVDWSHQSIDIYSMAVDGGDVRRHTDCKTVCTYPVPSPDGLFVAYRRVASTPGLTWELDPGARNSEVFVSSLDGASSLNVSNSPAYDGWPMWSPDGQWIVFASNRERTPYAAQIYAVKRDGDGIRPVTSGSLSRVQPSFNADGKFLYVYESSEGADFEFGHIARFPLTLGDAR